jgi:hypothetical protein
MTQFNTIVLQGLLERIRAGDELAGWELVQATLERLETLARNILRGFPNVARFERASDVLMNSLLRLLQRLRKAVLPTTRHYFRWASLQLREVVARGGPEPTSPKEPGEIKNPQPKTPAQALAEVFKKADLKVGDKPLEVNPVALQKVALFGDPAKIPGTKYTVHPKYNRMVVVQGLVSKLGTNAQCGMETGWLGNAGQWAVFASTADNSGLGLEQARLVVFLPWTKDGPGEPVVLEAPTPQGKLLSYLGSSPGYYLIRPR